jgi:hypothetical protein
MSTNAIERLFLSLLWCVSYSSCFLIPGDAGTGIKLDQKEDGIHFVFKNCRRSSFPTGIKELVIARSEDKDKKNPICILQTFRDDVDLKDWKYGEESKGYRLVKCEPLQPGQEYLLWAEGGSLGGVIRFSVGKDGKATVIMNTSC